MKNLRKLLVFIAFMAVLAFSMVSCDDGNGNTTIPDPCENGHLWGDYTQTTEPTCTEAGVKTRACTRSGCSVVDTVTETGDPALGHLAPAGYPPTCTTEGNTGTGECERCGEPVTGETIPALGHDFTGSWLSDASQHWKECIRDGCTAISGNGTTESAKESHTSNNAQATNCLTPDVCTVCEYVINPAKSNHNYPADNCTAPCTDCGTASQNSTHDFTGLWQSDASQHWKECTRCTAISGDGTTESAKESHSFTAGLCTVCGELDPSPAAFFGTWTRTEGNNQPYTITITENSFRFEDKNGDYVDFASISWTEDTNTATAHGAGYYTGIFTGDNSDPSLSYPHGFTINGTRTELHWGDSVIPIGFFMALSADGQTLYVAKSNSVYNIANFVSVVMSDSLFTRVSP